MPCNSTRSEKMLTPVAGLNLPDAPCPKYTPVNSPVSLRWAQFVQSSCCLSAAIKRATGTITV